MESALVYQREDAEILAQMVKRLRYENDLTVRELADKAGIQYYLVSNIENKKGNPTRKTLSSILAVFNMRMWEGYKLVLENTRD